MSGKVQEGRGARDGTAGSEMEIESAPGGVSGNECSEKDGRKNLTESKAK